MFSINDKIEWEKMKLRDHVDRKWITTEDNELWADQKEVRDRIR